MVTKSGKINIPVEAPADPMEPGIVDVLTIMQGNEDDPETKEPRIATKCFYRDASGAVEVKSHGRATWHRVRRFSFAGLEGLTAGLRGLSPQEHLVLGDPTEAALADLAAGNNVRRGHAQTWASLTEVDRRVVPIDMDNIPIPTTKIAELEILGFDPVTQPEEAAKHLRSLLPVEFHKSSCVWQLTSGAGNPTGDPQKAGSIYMRLYFLTSEGRAPREMKVWLEPYLVTRKQDAPTDPKHVIDGAVFTASQPIYAAAPVFAEGVIDPVPAGGRIGILRGEQDFVVPPPMTEAERQIIRRNIRKNRYRYDGGPETVTWDAPEDIAWAEREIDKEGLATTPVGEGNYVSNRAYALAARLGDGPAWGRALSEEVLEGLADRVSNEPGIIQSFLNGIHGRANPPGIGPLGSASRTFGNPPAWIEQKDGVTDEPMDFFGAITAPPALTRDMLPDAPASEYAFDVAERFGTTAEFSTIAYLGVCATAIHDDIKIERKAGHRERAQINMSGIGKISSGKTPLAKPFVEELRALEAAGMIAFRQAQAIYTMKHEAWKKQKDIAVKGLVASGVTNTQMPALPPEPERPRLKQFIVSDATTASMRDVLLGNTGGVLNYQNEMAGWLASFDMFHNAKGADQSYWVATDDGGPLTVNRVGFEDGPVFIPNVSASTIGYIQMTMLGQLRALRADGFLARIMPVYVGPDGEEKFIPENEIAKAAFKQLVPALAALTPGTEPVRYSPEAWEVCRRMELAVEGLARLPTTPAGLAAHLGKWRGKISRTALLYHVIECVSRDEAIQPHVSAATMERVNRFMLRFVLPHARRFYGEMVEGDEDDDTRWFAGHILAKKLATVSLRDLRKARNLKTEDDSRIYAAMENLMSAGWVGGAEPGRRKDQTVWVVNHRVHELFAKRAEYERAERKRKHGAIQAAAEAMRRGGIEAQLT